MMKLKYCKSQKMSWQYALANNIFLMKMVKIYFHVRK